MYFQGQGLDLDPAEGFRWFQKAAQQGLPAAQAMVGAIYLDGNVTGQDRARGLGWLRQAASRGLKEAQQVLKDLGQ